MPRLPVIIKRILPETIRHEVQYANGRREEVAFDDVLDAAPIASDAARDWEKDWTALRSPSPFKAESAEAASDRQRDALGAQLEEIGQALASAKSGSSPKLLELQADTAEALGDRYLADHEHIYAATMFAFARTSALAAHAARKAEGVPARVAVLDRKVAAVELAFLADTVIDHEGGDAAALARKNAEHRAQLASIREGFAKDHTSLEASHHDAFDGQRSKEAPAIGAKDAAAYGGGVAALGHALAVATDAFLAGLFTECEAQLGAPPCDYAVFALGSLAREDLTPCSDFEWAIIVHDEDARLTNLAYFHALARLLYLKVIALGETIAPAVGAPELVNVFDDTTRAGLSFDGMLDRGSKVPATPPHQYRYVAKEPDLLNPALTLGAESGAKAVQDPAYDKGVNTKTLATVMTSYRCIRGDARGAITARYRKATAAAVGVDASSDDAEVPRHRMLGRRKLVEAREQWTVDATLATREDPILVKKEMYRQVDILCDGLRLYYGLVDLASPWATLDAIPKPGGADGWDEATCAQIRLALAIAVDERWKATVTTGSGYGRLTPDDGDRDKIAVYLQAMKTVRARLATFLDGHAT